ncbi:long-chain-fatty-acid--CoA ligase [Pelagibacterium halotolerans]|uniref:Long-chain-fatty-acid--CoA ligase n=1 Tax=Pelagibacterium halotolerans (strain DSM 22347 / JCM 15775 / CGMCC 1.7692 / B2) TaxID=1082931 RepID=G4RA08_PELHB|nr:long-chain fatty acid--CoA ligase [Pelagibacterium halotolerans]AEQ52535.1 long-chain-fatty-acid--CoA ligase [Pelagibacterium halotolerans B2]QJR17744.1 long-chain fatty acid--CoA ligase [Pelagibacterium halotolerans]SEA39370.1 long-chain acyl-CoA synthetase [Pelagibacterium halotolerans]
MNKPVSAPHPWITAYPEGIEWDVPIDITPVHEQLLASCAKMGDAVALDFMGATTSFRRLGEKVNALAGALQSELGVAKGDRVALLMPNTPFYVIAYFAVLRIGATVVNCNPLYSLDELSHIVSNSGATVLVTLDLKATFPKAEKLVEKGHVKKLVVAHFPDALPGLKKILFSVLKGKDIVKPATSAAAQSVISFEELMTRGKTPAPVRIDPEKDVAVQQYTGGTTGTPKGAMLSHANIAANMSQIDKWGCGLFYPPSKVVAVLPFFHIFAMTVCMNVPLCSGAQVVMLPRFEMKAFLSLMKRTRPNILPAVPTLLHALATKDTATAEILAPLEVAISGGAGLPGETREAFAKKSDAILAEGYGLTEASPVVTCAALRVPSKPGSIGLPLPATDLRFVDLDDPEREVPQGERGELVLKGPQVMLGYFNDEEATKAVFTANGYLRTADVGYLDEDGYVFLVDRIKDLIISSGFNVYPRVIEDAIYHHPAVDETNVIGVKDEYRGEVPVAYVKLKDEQSVTEGALKSFLEERLSKLEMPREIIFRDELPKTMIGKLSKKDLREDYENNVKAGR